MKFGILSNQEVKRRRIKAVSVAAQEIQERRAPKVVPGAKPLHEYVNLYICARNPMMYVRSSQHAEICVLKIDTAVLNLGGVIIADGNAASGHTAFWQSPLGLAKIDKETVFAERWTDPNLITQWHSKRVKCAEVLVPDRLDPKFILGAYISCDEAKPKLEQLVPDFKTTMDSHLFFRG